MKKLFILFVFVALLSSCEVNPVVKDTQSIPMEVVNILQDTTKISSPYYLITTEGKDYFVQKENNKVIVKRAYNTNSADGPLLLICVILLVCIIVLVNVL